MSGIAGIAQLDGRPVARATMERMADVLAHRGPNGRGIQIHAHVGLCHLLLHTTPESLQERQPLSNASGTAAIVADARLDNRAELGAALGLSPAALRELPDAALILRAYGEWGMRSPERLLGDFAFAIWDAHRQQLFCARDHFGVKPFYYFHEPGRLFAFGSEIKALLALPDVPRHLNERKLADFLVQRPDLVGTFFKGIRRLQPAHALIVAKDRAVIRRYWELDGARETHLRSMTEYAEMYRDIFAESVRCRLRSAFPAGSMLSGGLDSSSIVCTARELNRHDTRAPLHTYSLVFDQPVPGDDRPYIDDVLAGGELIPAFVNADRLSPLEDAERFLWHMDEPWAASNLAFHWAMFRAAGTDGVRVLLDGILGDEVVFQGHFYLAELLRRGKLIALTRLLSDYRRNTRHSAWWIFKHYVAKPIAPPWLLGVWERAHRRTPNPAMLARVAQNKYENARDRHYRALIAASITTPLEAGDRIAAAFGIEPRYPFCDKRLVEFCLSVPPRFKFHRGWPRSLARFGLGGILPESVRWRISKGHMDGWYYRNLVRFESERLDRLFGETPELLRDVVDTAALRHAHDSYRKDHNAAAALELWRPLILSAWLHRNPFSPWDHNQEGGGASQNTVQYHPAASALGCAV